MAFHDGKSLGVDEGSHYLVDSLGDESLDLLTTPPPRDRCQFLFGPVHLIVVCPEGLVVGLGNARLGKCRPAQQTCLEHRATESEGGGLGDDRLVEIEERDGGHPHKLIPLETRVLYDAPGPHMFESWLGRGGTRSWG
jgi:hypothetical protein